MNTETYDRPVRLDTADELDELVATNDRVLVEFYTNGCGICASLEPVLGNVARVTDAVVAMVNPRDDPRLIEEYTVRSVPTLLLFDGGDLLDRRDEGFQDTQSIVEWVESA